MYKTFKRLIINELPFFFVLMLLAGCGVKKKEMLHDVLIEDVVFSLFTTVNVNEIPESLTQNRRYIKLDNSKDDFLIGKIDKVRIVNDKIFILDKRQRALIAFDITGKGLCKIGEQGRGPHEYLRIHDFDVDKNGNVYFLDGTLRKLFIYDAEFNIIDSFQ